ncbi:hypothetical protein [Lysobacter tyrosinilyticus]
MWRVLGVLPLLACLVSCGSRDFLLRRDIPPSGALSESFLVAEEKFYAAQITYLYPEEDRGVRRLAWNAAGGIDGAPFDVRLRLTREGEVAPIYDQLIHRPPLTSWGAGELNAELMRASLRPAKYSIEIRVVNGTVPAVVKATFDVVEAHTGK